MATTLQDILLTQDYMGKYRNILFSKTTELIEPKLYMDVHWMVLYKITVFCSSLIFKISTWPPGKIIGTFLLSLVPIGKVEKKLEM
jgi:hypothetical protein